MRRRALVAAIVAAVVTVGANASASQGSTPTWGRLAPSTVAGRVAARIGFTQGSSLLGESDQQLATDLAGMHAVGARWLAVDFDWSAVQAQRGTFDWSHIDRVVAAARTHQLNVVAIVAYTPAWARAAGTTDKTPPTRPWDYAHFAAAAAQRYSPLGVHDFQIWNEPNVNQFWVHPDPARYTALLNPAYAAIHAVDQHAVVLAGGLAPAADVSGSSWSPYTFLDGVYRAGGHGHFDALSMHPYTFPWAPTTVATWNPLYMARYAHAQMAQHGDAALQIWATEMGYGTGHDGQSVSESTQAQRVVQMLTAWTQYPFAGPALLYNFRDLGSSASVWDHMGVRRPDGSAKPALWALLHLERNGR